MINEQADRMLAPVGAAAKNNDPAIHSHQFLVEYVATNVPITQANLGPKSRRFLW